MKFLHNWSIARQIFIIDAHCPTPEDAIQQV